MPDFSVRYQPKDKVRIDGSYDLIACVTEISIRTDGVVFYVLYAVEWMHNGINQSAYMPEWRLTLVPAKNNG